MDQKKLVLFFGLIFLQLVFYFTILFNVPVARQIIGFVYFTFLPGLVIAINMKLDFSDFLEVAILIVGFSIAYLMIAGLLINEIGLMLGISEPLSTIPSMAILSVSIFLAAALTLLRSNHIDNLKFGTCMLSKSTVILLLVPILSIGGVIYMNCFGDNRILLFMIVLMSSLFAISIISKKTSSKFYSLAIFIFAVALLYHASLISNYIIAFGSDIPIEQFLFQTTQINGHWNATSGYSEEIYSRIYSMLSVTILPTIYSNLLCLDCEWILKIIFPLIFSFVPITLYFIWKKYVGEKRAFISTFFFMSFETFYTEMLGLTRQMIAELFFVLLLFIFLNKTNGKFGKHLCFIIFSFALVVSHYGVSLIFLFFISFALVIFLLLRKRSSNITTSIVLLFFVIMFLWYIYTTRSSVFDSIVRYGNNVRNQLQDFFNFESREREVLRGVALESPPTIWNMISRVFAYITEFLIVVGFVSLVLKRAKIIDKTYFIFIHLAMALLIALILVPGLANTLNMTRFFHVLLFFLAPLCVIGAEFIVKFVFRRKTEILCFTTLLVILVPYFLFQSSFVYEIVGSQSWSVPLSKYRMEPLRLYLRYGYTDAVSVFGARWLSKNTDTTMRQIYADDVAKSPTLLVYGMIYLENVESLSNVTRVTNHGIVYLSTFNVVHETIVHGNMLYNCSEIMIFKSLNVIYSNGGSTVYENSP